MPSKKTARVYPGRQTKVEVPEAEIRKAIFARENETLLEAATRFRTEIVELREELVATRNDAHWARGEAKRLLEELEASRKVSTFAKALFSATTLGDLAKLAEDFRVSLGAPAPPSTYGVRNVIPGQVWRWKGSVAERGDLNTRVLAVVGTAIIVANTSGDGYARLAWSLFSKEHSELLETAGDPASVFLREHPRVLRMISNTLTRARHTVVALLAEKEMTLLDLDQARALRRRGQGREGATPSFELIGDLLNDGLVCEIEKNRHDCSTWALTALGRAVFLFASKLAT